MKIDKADEAAFTTTFRKYDNMRPPEDGADEAPEVQEFRENLASISDICKDSDLIQKVLMRTELQVARSRNPDALVAALILFLSMGLEIGSQIPTPASQAVN